MRQKRYLVALTWLATGLSSPALAQKVGPEFQVNTYTPGEQSRPSVASDASGNFVVVWESYQDGGIPPFGELGVFGQRYDRDGNRLGNEFQVNTFTSFYQRASAVASAPDGSFVVVWNSFGQDGSGEGVFGRRYDSDGNRLGNEFQVNTYTTGTQISASVASDANGNFVVVWSGDDFDGVFGQRYDRGGNPLGNEFQVNTYTTDRRYGPQVASDALGNFVVVWTSVSQDGGGGYRGAWGVFGQRYDSDGNRLGGEFQVNTYTRNAQESPNVASDAIGNFVVVWESYRQEEGDQDIIGDGVFGQRYDAAGNHLGGEFQVNTYTTNHQDQPSVVSGPSGDFIVVWHSAQEDGNHGIFGQRYDSDGHRVGGEFHVNTYTTGSQKDGVVASDASGNFIVVWQSEFQDGGGGAFDYGVFGQRFSAACEASLHVQGDVHAPGSMIPVRVHIAHHRPRTVTVPWELRLSDGNGQQIVRRVTEPHTFEPGDVVDRNVEFQLPDDLTSGTYTLELAISGMAGTKGATTTLRVVRAE